MSINSFCPPVRARFPRSRWVRNLLRQAKHRPRSFVPVWKTFAFSSSGSISLLRMCECVRFFCFTSLALRRNAKLHKYNCNAVLRGRLRLKLYLSYPHCSTQFIHTILHVEHILVLPIPYSCLTWARQVQPVQVQLTLTFR